MADLSPPEQQLLREKWQPLLEEHWVAGGESVLWVELPAQGYVGSVVNQRLEVPHAPKSEVRESLVDAPDWPLPSEQVTAGAFLDDEWADDPSIMWWVHAAAQERDAVLLGDHIANVPGQAFLVLSTNRLAVVVAEKQLAATEPQGPASAGLFGRARAAVHQVQRAAGELAPSLSEDVPVSYFEVPLSRIARMSAARLGRSIPRSAFLRIDFADGSTVFTRTDSGSAEAKAMEFTHLRSRP
ncbi:hypothetical protein HUO13_24820 [Saccharopolyspora erythraea]|uniref:hypothetical protein n=1 Tax=Saccharopolyspora erythraea TaxID=1836 RepID=UPI001BA89DC9|nr:hypothetical protein [Saccharopolyspora erythraea]QUH03614.1 hypothetical protein HUO13_24820 [Saccharopolyspora erythraea]